MKKIAVIGSGGSGKSTFSRELGKITGLPVYHLDAIHWKPGWVPTPPDEWDRIIANLVERDEWIIDGNYGRTMDPRLRAADTVIFLDMPRYLCMYRIVKRVVMYRNKTRPDLTEGCNERLTAEFVRWVWTFRKKKRPDILKKLEALKNEKKIVILQSPAEVKAFLRELRMNWQFGPPGHKAKSMIRDAPQ